MSAAEEVRDSRLWKADWRRGRGPLALTVGLSDSDSDRTTNVMKSLFLWQKIISVISWNLLKSHPILFLLSDEFCPDRVNTDPTPPENLGSNMSDTTDLDQQIESLRKCEIIKESDVKNLCSKAREILGTWDS